MCQICDTNYGNTRENSGNAGKVNQYILTDTADLPGYRFRISPPPLHLSDHDRLHCVPEAKFHNIL